MPAAEYLRSKDMEKILVAALVTLAMVRTIPRSKLGSLLLPDVEGRKTIRKKPTYALVRLGFDIYSDDYIVVDPDFYINY